MATVAKTMAMALSATASTMAKPAPITKAMAVLTTSKMPAKTIMAMPAKTTMAKPVKTTTKTPVPVLMAATQTTKMAISVMNEDANNNGIQYC